MRAVELGERNAAMEGSDDIFVHKFSISMGGKTLFKDAKLSLAHGRRYGLIGAPPARHPHGRSSRH